MKAKLRELLIFAKIMQFCADIFAVFGLFLFAYIYFVHWQQNPLAALGALASNLNPLKLL